MSLKDFNICSPCLGDIAEETPIRWGFLIAKPLALHGKKACERLNSDE
jgi:hypothetical protein